MEDEELKSLQLDKPQYQDVRSEEQLRRHTIDKTLEEKPIDRVLYILSKGEEIQKLSVIRTLPRLLAEDVLSCITRVIPKVQQTLPTASTEFHMAASSTFKQILEQRLVSHSTFTQIFLQSTLNSLENRDPVISHAWLDTVLDVIELLPADVVRQEILPIATNKGQLSQPISSRITCCKLMGKIATRFDATLIKKEVLPVVQSLCQDVNSDVRGCICLELRYVAEGLGAETTKLLPSVVELASDEETNVIEASVQTIVHLLPHLSDDSIKTTIIPLIQKLCDSALKSEDEVIVAIAREYGRLTHSMESCLSPEERTWFIRRYKLLAKLGILTTKSKPSAKQDFVYFAGNNTDTSETYLQCRKQCAFNIPAMFNFTLASSEGENSILTTFRELATDSYHMVRRTIACGIHEVLKVLGAKGTLIKSEIVKLLRDDSEEVLQGLVPHISQILENLAQNRIIAIDQLDAGGMEIGKALIKCEAEISLTNNWRLESQMLGQLEILPRCFPSDFIYMYFESVIMNRILYSRPLPVRMAACRTYLIFLRYNLKAQQRIELRNRIFVDLASSANCYVRMLFIRMMTEAMSLFSTMYFKEHFCTMLLNMTEDPVANVRMKVVSLLVRVKSSLRLPVDKKLLSTLETNVRNLMNNEKDRDVIAALVESARQLDSIEIKVDGQAALSKLSRYDSDDVKKYEEEKKLEGTATGKAALQSMLAANPPKKPPAPRPTARVNVVDVPAPSSATRQPSTTRAASTPVRPRPHPSGSDTQAHRTPPTSRPAGASTVRHTSTSATVARTMGTETANMEQSQELQKAGFKRKPNDSLWNVGNKIDQEEPLRVKGCAAALGETKRARAATHYHPDTRICYDHNVQNFLHRLSAVQNIYRIFAMQKAVLYSYAAERYFSKGVWGIPNTEPTRTIEVFKEILRKYSAPNAEATNCLHNFAFHAPIQRFASFRWPETVEVDGDLDDDLDELEIENEEDETIPSETRGPTFKVLAKQQFSNAAAVEEIEAKREKPTVVSSTDGQEAAIVNGDENGSLQDLEVGTSSDAKISNDVPISSCSKESILNEIEKNVKPDIKANYFLNTSNPTPNWGRFASNSTQPWERLSSSNSAVNVALANTSHFGCSEFRPCRCHEPAGRLLRSQSFHCPCFGNTEYLPTTSFFQKHEYQPSIAYFPKSPFSLTQPLGNRHDLLRNLLLHRESYSGKGRVSDLETPCYNPCWAFSSAPDMPVTLLDDEFMVDAGVRIPQLASTPVPVPGTSKIPNLQDIIYRNKKIGDPDRSRRCGAIFDKPALKPFRHNLDEGVKSQDLPCTLQDRSKANFGGLSRFGFDTSRKTDVKRHLMIAEKNAVDRNKRHSATFGLKLPDTKDKKMMYKRHSMEVSEYGTAERNNRVLRRYSALDVNHNQGLSKIPLRSSQVSGSRTAPVTRAPSPIHQPQCASEASFEKTNYNDKRAIQREKYISRFTSSDEEVDKLCQKLLNSQTDPVGAPIESPKARDSRLPVRLQKKKL